MSYLKKIDEQEKDTKKVVAARVSEDVLTALSAAEADSENFGYSFSITEIINKALNDTLQQITEQTMINYYELVKWEKRVKKSYIEINKFLNIDHQHNEIFKDHSFLYEPNISGSESVMHTKGKVSKEVLKKMKDGSIVSACPSIDLHGHKIEEACQSLSQFIHFHQNEPFIHVIHGKGYHSDNGLSIIKSQVVHYLKQHPNVLAFTSCPENMGGTGALIVHIQLLEKDNEEEANEFIKGVRKQIMADKHYIQNENYLIDFENQLTSTWNKAVVNQHPNFSVDHSGKIMPKPGTFANLKKG